MDTLLFTAFGLAALVAILVMLGRPAAFRLPESAAEKLDLEQLFPVHCRYFPQVRQVLSPSDKAFLRARASPQLVREWREARRRVARDFLSGLFDDFARLNRLARTLARMAPQLDNLREAELFWLSIRFRVIYELARLQLAIGLQPLENLRDLAGLVGGLGSTLEKAVIALSEGSHPQRLTSVSL